MSSHAYATTTCTYVTASSKASCQGVLGFSQLSLGHLQLVQLFSVLCELLLSSWSCVRQLQVKLVASGLQQPEQLHEDTLCHMQPWYIASTKKRPHTLHRSSTFFACIHSKILKLFIKTPALHSGVKKKVGYL